MAAAVAGIIGALMALAALPALFGVNPYDLVRGKVGREETAGDGSAVDEAVETVSTAGREADVAAIARKVIPSIVNIDVQSRVRGFRGFDYGVEEGTGSGVIYRSDGYIITNDHVVGNAEAITVTLASGEQLDAETVGTDPGSDIAVIKVDKSDLPALSLGDSEKLEVGEAAVAVGSPYGFEQTVTSGIISAMDRSITVQSATGGTVELTGLLQTDAAINPGNSGGALCDSSARLVGVATLIASSSGGSEGIGFAIPADRVKRVADALIAGRSVNTVTQGRAARQPAAVRLPAGVWAHTPAGQRPPSSTACGGSPRAIAGRIPAEGWQSGRLRRS